MNAASLQNPSFSMQQWRIRNTPNIESQKETHLKERLPFLSEDEMLVLLAGDGMLVKRPMLIGDDFVLVGF